MQDISDYAQIEKIHEGILEITKKSTLFQKSSCIR